MCAFWFGPKFVAGFGQSFWDDFLPRLVIYAFFAGGSGLLGCFYDPLKVCAQICCIPLAGPRSWVRLRPRSHRADLSSDWGPAPDLPQCEGRGISDLGKSLANPNRGRLPRFELRIGVACFRLVFCRVHRPNSVRLGIDVLFFRNAVRGEKVYAMSGDLCGHGVVFFCRHGVSVSSSCSLRLQINDGAGLILDISRVCLT